MKNKGLTVVEIFIVIVIITAITGIAIVKLKGMRDEADVSTAESELMTVKTALESYYINSPSPHAYPSVSSTMEKDFLVTANPRIMTTLSPLYDPFGATATTEYAYFKSPDGNRFLVCSRGAGRALGVSGVGNDGSIANKDADDICVGN